MVRNFQETVEGVYGTAKTQLGARELFWKIGIEDVHEHFLRERFLPKPR